MRYRIYSIGNLPTLKIHHAGYSSDISGTTFINRNNKSYLVGYVLSGTGRYNDHIITAGQGFIFMPNVSENVYPDKSDPLELLWFTSADPRFEELLVYYKADRKTNIFSHKLPAELQHIKEIIVSENRATISNARMLEFFFSVFKHHMSEEKLVNSAPSASQSYIDFSINYIKNHYNNITVTQLTKLIGVSQPYLYRIFKETFGKSPKAFITEYRINQAKKFLSETELSISDIALSVGYSDSFSFSKAFSLLQGVSPSEYRLQKRNKNQ